jgi:hypothetical protein
VQSCHLFVGTTPGAHDLVTSAILPSTQTSYNVPALPTGSTLWARIRTRGSDGLWRFTDVSFTAAPR